MATENGYAKVNKGSISNRDKDYAYVAGDVLTKKEYLSLIRRHREMCEILPAEESEEESETTE